MELDLHSPICLHGLPRDKFTFTILMLFLMVVLIIMDPVNPSAWGHLNPSSYCDVGRFFLRAFKF